MSAAMTGSSSMISTSVASSASISAWASAISRSTSAKSAPRIWAASRGREALERGQQEGLARARRDAHQPAGGVVDAGRRRPAGLPAGRRWCTRWRGTRDRAPRAASGWLRARVRRRRGPRARRAHSGRRWSGRRSGRGRSGGHRADAAPGGLEDSRVTPPVVTELGSRRAEASPRRGPIMARKRRRREPVPLTAGFPHPDRGRSGTLSGVEALTRRREQIEGAAAA